MLEKTDFSGRQEGERIEIFVRSHLLYLLWRLLPPALLFAAALALEVVLLDRFPTLSGVWIFSSLWLVFLPVLWLVWRFALWYYDYFIVTDRRVIDFVRRPFTSETRNETQLGRIQDARVVFPNSVALALNIGHVIVQTAGMTGQLEFRYAPRPHWLHARLLELSASQQGPRAESGSLGQLIGALRSALDAPPPGATTGSAPGTSDPAARRPPSSPSQSRRLRDLVFVRVAPVAHPRTWRKHWLFLLKAAFRPAVVLALAIGLLILVPNQMARVVAMGLLFVGALYLAWQTSDWYNDVYIVTDDRIIDVREGAFHQRGQARGSLDHDPRCELRPAQPRRPPLRLRRCGRSDRRPDRGIHVQQSAKPTGSAARDLPALGAGAAGTAGAGQCRGGTGLCRPAGSLSRSQAQEPLTRSWDGRAGPPAAGGDPLAFAGAVSLSFLIRS